MTSDSHISLFMWHYAPQQYLAKIVSTGALRLSNAGATSEKPLIWFSANQHWEPTATKMVSAANGPRRMTFHEQQERFGCVRFGIPSDDLRLMSWAAACTFAGTPPEESRSMEAVGLELGARPSDWFATGVDIPLAGLRFEVWRNERWQEDDAQKLIDRSTNRAPVASDRQSQVKAEPE